ncbi:MAG: hypothetical protein JJ966_06245 [Balneolaceae bacterium]|nr:hypothetical protein [Balneolaceae bacterium]
MTGFFYIIASVICSIAIAHLLKLARNKELSIVPILTVNYAVASLISGFQIEHLDVITDAAPATLVFALFTGALFIINFFLYSFSLHKNGVGVSVAAMRLSLVLPVLVSLFWYKEFLNSVNYLGIFIVFVALVLLLPKSQKSNTNRVFSYSLLLLFFLNGLVDVLLKIYDREFTSALPKEAFLALIFSSAFILGLSYMALKGRVKFSRKHLFYGVLVGIVNLYSSYFILLALEMLEGALVFSLTNILNVLLGTLLGIFYWKDLLSRTQIFGLIAAIIAIILLII